MGKIIAISNQKGGVGKTTTAINLAAGLGYLRNKVLLVDFDPQGNASQGVGAAKADHQLTVYNMLMEEYEPDAVIEHLSKPPIDIIPANISLAGADLEMVQFEAGKEELLKKKLDLIRDRYDYIIIDCPPSLGIITTNALCAADTLLVPIQCEYYALEGLSQLMNSVRRVKRQYNEQLDLEGVLLTMYDGRLNLTQQVVEEVKKYFPRKVFATTIPRTVRLSEAPSFGKPILYFDRSSKGAKAYRELAKEVEQNHR